MAVIWNFGVGCVHAMEAARTSWAAVINGDSVGELADTSDSVVSEVLLIGMSLAPKTNCCGRNGRDRRGSRGSIGWKEIHEVAWLGHRSLLFNYALDDSAAEFDRPNLGVPAT